MNRRCSSRIRLLTLVAAWTAGVLAGVVDAQPSSPRSAAVWFEDLADAKPMAAAAQQDLARYLTELAFDSPSRAGKLPASLAGDRETRMIFLSLGDGVTRARVLRAAGRGVAEAAVRLSAEVRSLVGGGFEVRVVRFDLVTEVRRRQASADRASTLPRSLYGLAFEREIGLAFLAGEVVAHTLINSDQELRLRNVRKRPAAAGVLSRLESLAESAEVPVFRFATASTFSEGGDPAPLYRGHRRFADLGPEELLHHAELGGRYLARSVDPLGRFVYAYLPKTDKDKDKYNALRHCGTIYSMLELYEASGERELLQAADRAIGYLERELTGRCQVGGVETACIVERGAVKLGGNALAIVALAKHVAVTGDTRHAALIDELGRWILLTQGEDGEFKIHKQSHPEGEIIDFTSGYYPGEALLALVRRPESDPAGLGAVGLGAEWLDAAERGARWLINVRDRDLPISALNHDHWLLYALGELHRRRPDPLYLEHAKRITGAIFGGQRQRDPEFPDWLGSYYSPPRSTPTATRSEGLGAAYLMMRDAGRAEWTTAILEALKLGVRFQLQTQFLPETVLYLSDPARALGGFHRSLTDYEIRIDYVQHNISALLLLRRILLEQPAMAGPSEREKTTDSPKDSSR